MSSIPSSSPPIRVRVRVRVRYPYLLSSAVMRELAFISLFLPVIRVRVRVRVRMRELALMSLFLGPALSVTVSCL